MNFFIKAAQWLALDATALDMHRASHLSLHRGLYRATPAGYLLARADASASPTQAADLRRAAWACMAIAP